MTIFRGADIVYRPKFLLTGRLGDAQIHLARAVIQARFLSKSTDVYQEVVYFNLRIVRPEFILTGRHDDAQVHLTRAVIQARLPPVRQICPTKSDFSI